MILREKDKALAAIFETAGQFFYVYALDTNSVVVAPMIASYSIVSVILGRIFLKEKLSLKQYLIIAIVMVGIFLLGLFE
jgi:drug/metabolite transporter (DMT)-like permease